MFSNYLYTSSTSKTFRDHFVDAANKYVKELKLKAGDKVSQNDLILTLKIDQSEIVSSETLENSISSISFS